MGVAEQQARESWCGVKSLVHRFAIYLTYQSSCTAQLCKADKGIDQGDEAARLLAVMKGTSSCCKEAGEEKRGGGAELHFGMPPP